MGSCGLGSIRIVPVEADLVLVLDDQVQEAAELVQLLAHAAVGQAVVPFASAPQHVVGAAQVGG